MCNFINKDNFKVSNFYRFPKVLMSKRYDSLMLESKVAYSFFLDMVSLSIENGWINERGEVFVKIKRKELMKKLGIKGAQKMAKIMEELNDFGLIFEKRVGLGRCNEIFLCDLENVEEREEREESFKVCGENVSKAQDELCCGLDSFENQISEDNNSNFKNCENQNSEIRKSNFKGFDFQNHNKTNINKTKNIKTNLTRTQSNQGFNKSFDFKTLEDKKSKLKTFENQNSVDKVNNFVDEKDDLNNKKLEMQGMSCKNTNTKGLSHKEANIKVLNNKKYDYDIETLDTARELLGWSVDYKDANTLLKEACGNLYILDLAYEKMVKVKGQIENVVGYLRTVLLGA